MPIQELKSRLRSDIISSVEGKVYAVAEKSLREAIMTTMYASGGGTSYVRTGDFMNAIAIENKKNTGSTAEFTVLIKGSMLTPNFTGDSGWNQHMDMSGSSWNGDGIVEVMDEGTKSRSLYMHSGYRFYDKAEKDMDNKLIKTLASAMSGHGWDVRII